MKPVSPCREPKSSDPIPMPKIFLFRNDSYLPCLEPPCYDPCFERFHFGPGYPNTMLFNIVNELPDQELCWFNVPNSVDGYEDEDDDHSMSGSRFSSQSGWKSAVKRFNMIAKCFRPPATQSFRNIPVTPSGFSSPRHSRMNGGEDRSILWQEDIEDIEEEEEEEGGDMLLEEEEEEEAVEYDDVSHPTASLTSSPSNRSNHSGEGY